MDDLTYTLRTLCRRNRDGSHATQADRLHALTLASRQLREMGYRQLRATSLKRKHVDALLERSGRLDGVATFADAAMSGSDAIRPQYRHAGSGCAA